MSDDPTPPPSLTHPSDAPSSRWQRWGTRLNVRIWLAMLAAFTALLVLVGWAWNLTQPPPLREVLVRDETGEVIGRAERLPPRYPESSPWLPDDDAPATELMPSGPEFLVHLDDGQELFIQLPLPASRMPFGRGTPGFLWLLAVAGLAAAIATYPIIKHLTRRLNVLQRAVERFGSGDLSSRVALEGQDEVGRLARRFNWAAARIETLLASHKTLLANASHELRTPLARLRMGLVLLQADPQGPHAADNAREIERNIAELDQLIGEILLASRLDAQVADMGTVESIDLIGLVAEECVHTDAAFSVRINGPTDDSAQAAITQTANTQNANTLSPDSTPPAAITVLGVDKLVRRLVRNLLENARRYSPGAPEVELSLQPHDPPPSDPGQHAGWATLTVADRGPGVPTDQRSRIFEPFYRLPGASEGSGGVGLGLALVKSITSRMGGTVHCEANPGGGARFVVRLPVHARPPQTIY